MKSNKILAGALLALTLVGCSGVDEIGGYSGRASGTAGGAAVGALIGQVIGQNTKGTLIGAGVGSLLGLTWGAYRDKQAAELKEKLRGTEVEVRTEGENLTLNLPGGVTFASDSDRINSNFYTSLNGIAQTLIAYPESRILIYGYTDSTGGDAHNQALSERRADSVAQYLVGQGVALSRITAAGFGESNPVATNSTEAGKQANRRVEIKIVPLKAAN